MTKKQINDFHNLVYLKYRNQIKISFDDVEPDDFSAYVGENLISIPKCIREKQSEWTLFAFLHELGHIKTNTITMKRYEMEYLATQWALYEAKIIGFVVPDSIVDTYQDYINKWRSISVSQKEKNVWPKSKIQLRK